MGNNGKIDPQTAKIVKVYLNSQREVEIFSRVKEALGEDDSGTFVYILKNYADERNFISEALHEK